MIIGEWKKLNDFSIWLSDEFPNAKRIDNETAGYIKEAILNDKSKVLILVHGNGISCEITQPPTGQSYFSTFYPEDGIIISWDGIFEKFSLGVKTKLAKQVISDASREPDFLSIVKNVLVPSFGIPSNFWSVIDERISLIDYSNNDTEEEWNIFLQSLENNFVIVAYIPDVKHHRTVEFFKEKDKVIDALYHLVETESYDQYKVCNLNSLEVKEFTQEDFTEE